MTNQIATFVLARILIGQNLYLHELNPLDQLLRLLVDIVVVDGQASFLDLVLKVDLY